MNLKHSKSCNWAYLPLIFSSATILTTQVSAGGFTGQQYEQARQVGAANYEYVGGHTQVGGYITDDGDVSADINHVFRETDTSSSSIGLWGGVDLDEGDDKKGGVQLNHNWVSTDNRGNATHINKVFAAYDRNEDDHDKATVGYGQEYENMFWEGHVSKGLSDKKAVAGLTDANGKQVYSKAYDYGVGGSVGTFLKDSNTRIRAGLDHEWGDDVGNGEDDATNTTLSAGIEKFFQGTPHSVSLDVAASRKDGGTQIAGYDDTDVSASMGYHYDFGGASIYQPDQRYRRVRVEIPGKGRSARYARKPIYKRVPTYKNVPVYGKQEIKKPFKQIVKNTMELEGQTFFKLNSAKLIPSAKQRLLEIAGEIRKNGYRGAIRITGNTCGLGDPVYDQRLSEQRAKSVRNFLIKQGFEADHLIARGLGKGSPKYPNTPSQGFKNRRVDIEYVTESQSYKTGYRTEQKTVQTGTRQVATGFKNVVAGYKDVMIDSGAPGAPRVIWRTEAIKTSPAWIKRALHNNIQHNRDVNTYLATDFVGQGSEPETPNTAPVANIDFTKTNCNQPVPINVLSNDSDPDGDNLVITDFTQPSNGSVTRGANGQLIYTPNSNACGETDSFTYTISDGNGGSSTATVTIDVAGATNPEPTNQDPVAINDYEKTRCNTPVKVNVLSNDTDPENDSLSVTDFTNGTYGTVTRGANGQLIYTPNSDACGESDSFKYTISDGNGGTSTATVTIDIAAGPDPEPVNVAPVAVNDSATANCSAVTINVLKNDYDADGDSLNIISLGKTALGTAVISGNNIIYTPTKSCGPGTDTFSYTISDGNGHTASADVSVAVKKTGCNTKCTKAEADDITTYMGQPVTINVLANDEGSGLHITEVDSPSHGTAKIIGNAIKYTPAPGFTGTDSFWYQIKDGTGYLDAALILVYVEKSDCHSGTKSKCN